MSEDKQPDEKLVLDIEKTLLAGERTFLAWLRTGLTAIGLGIAIARFLVFKNITHQEAGHRVGQLLVLWGIGLLIFALISYRRSSVKLLPLIPHRQLAYQGLTLFTIALILLCVVISWIVVD